MNLKIFKKRLAVYGADFTRWPEGGASTRPFMATSAKAQKSHATAARLEEVLNIFETPFADAALKDRITDYAFQAAPAGQTDLRRHAARTQREFFRWPVLVPAGAVAAMIAAVLFVTNLNQTAQIDAFMNEWSQMTKVAAQEEQQADEMLEVLVASAQPRLEAEIDQFLDELQMQEEGLEDYL